MESKQRMRPSSSNMGFATARSQSNFSARRDIKLNQSVASLKPDKLNETEVYIDPKHKFEEEPK